MDSELILTDAIEGALWRDLADYLNTHHFTPSTAPTLANARGVEPIDRLAEWGLDPLWEMHRQQPDSPWTVIDAGDVIHGGATRDPERHGPGYFLRWDTCLWLVIERAGEGA